MFCTCELGHRDCDTVLGFIHFTVFVCRCSRYSLSRWVVWLSRGFGSNICAPFWLLFLLWWCCWNAQSHFIHYLNTPAFKVSFFFLKEILLFSKHAWNWCYKRLLEYRNILWFPQKHEAAQLLSTLVIHFFEHQISILEWFLKDHVTLKTKYKNKCSLGLYI